MIRIDTSTGPLDKRNDPRFIELLKKEESWLNGPEFNQEEKSRLWLHEGTHLSVEAGGESSTDTKKTRS
jgi:hypothetical protein